jgi:hypothetical protein
LDFVPLQTSRTTGLTRVSIPAEYSECDQIEVFVYGRRLRKDQVSVYEETLGSQGTGVSTVLEPEFTVDGSSAYIRLTTQLPENTPIIVIRKIGKTWYDRTATSASKGVTLTDNVTSIARFIDEKYSQLP